MREADRFRKLFNRIRRVAIDSTIPLFVCSTRRMYKLIGSFEFSHHTVEPRLYGVMAEFEGPNELVHAARRTYEEGYRRINGYSPYPIEELSEAIGFTHSALPLIVFIGGVVGLLGGFFLHEWFSSVVFSLN